MEEKKEEFSNIIIFNKYLSEQKLGEGSFGQVYRGFNIVTKEKVAIKLEDREKGINLLETEAYNMSYLKGDGIPQLYCYGNTKTYNILIMELLGNSLESHFETCNRKFSLKTVLLLTVQMIERIQHIHNKNLVHRDIKPENYMTGYGEPYRSKIYLIDFGLSFKYRSSKTKEHIKLTTGKTMTGTARYASLNALRGCEQSRRDDLESLGYVWIYFLNSKLPWQGVKAKTIEQKIQLILEKKSLLSVEKLCQNIPKQFATYLAYCRQLEFTAQPDYGFLIKLFIDLMEKNNIDPYDLEFDWISNEQPSPSKRNYNISHLENKSELNKTGNILINGNDKNQSINISQIHNNNNDSMIQKKPTLVNGIRRKGTITSSKKVSFGKVEFLSNGADGKPETKVIELKNTMKSDEKLKKQNKSCHCNIY